MRIGAMAVGLCLSLAAKQAWAEDDTAPQGPVPVTISGAKQSTSFRVVEVHDDVERTLVTCDGSCSFAIPPGKYRLYSSDTRTGEHDDVGMRVRHATNYRFQEGNRSAKNTGLALGIGGPILVGVGAILILPALFASICEGSTCMTDGERTAAKIGLGSILVGAIATPIGWTMFGSNRTKLIDLREDVAVSRPFQLRIGLGALAPGAFGLAGTGRF